MAAISARRSDRARLTGALSLDPDLEALLRAQGALGTPDLAAMPLAQALTRMAAAAKGFKVESVKNSDLAWVAVGAGGGE